MSPRMQRFCAWSGPLFVLVAFPGYVLAGLFPPPAPSDTAAQVAARWAENTDVKAAGLVLMLWGACFQMPFGAFMAWRMKQMGNPVLAAVMVAGAALAVLAITMPAMVFAACALRPDRDPQTLQALNDFGWMLFVMNTPPALLQCGSLAFAILGDRSERPVLSRTVGFYNLWTAFLFLPGGFCVFYLDGVLAWDGALAYWIVAVLFGAWFLVMGAIMARTVRDEPAAGGPAT